MRVGGEGIVGEGRRGQRIGSDLVRIVLDIVAGLWHNGVEIG